MTANKGGKREGAGRKPAHPLLKKRLVSIRLPEWLLNWMDEQPDTNRAVLIEHALKKVHQIEPPSDT
ncbi:MAG: hypothetical protein RBQ99_01630 [Trichlorobacter sp.]|jgi:hypothetical protein|nr:hypothetical protein [Trichlorobacter sp.]